MLSRPAAVTDVDRVELDARIASVTPKAPHRPEHIAAFVDAVLAHPARGCLVECGVYQGVGTAKLSHLAAALGRTLWAFDSFEGLPPHDEQHTVTRQGIRLRDKLAPGRFAASLGEAQATVARYGVPEVVWWVPGWFATTLPAWAAIQHEPVAAVYLDVDLADSVRTCLEHLWPLVIPGGVVVSQDGDLPGAVDAMREWAARVDPEPTVTGLGQSTMVVFRR
jgi:O-methyltransferase